MPDYNQQMVDSYNTFAQGAGLTPATTIEDINPYLRNMYNHGYDNALRQRQAETQTTQARNTLRLRIATQAMQGYIAYAGFSVNPREWVAEQATLYADALIEKINQNE